MRSRRPGRYAQADRRPLDAAIAKVLAEPEVKKSTTRAVSRRPSCRRRNTRPFPRRDSVTWGDVVRKGNIKIDE